MNDVEKKDPVPTDVLAKQGVAAVAQAAGGALLFLMNAFGRFRPLGIGLGLLAAGVGISALLSKDPADKKPGAIIAAAGILELIVQFGIPFMKPIAGFLLTVSSLGLLALGIVNGIRFLRGLKSRQ